MSDLYCVAGKSLLTILTQNGIITEADVAEKCHRLRHSTEEIYAAVCGTLKPEEQCLLKHLLNKIDEAKIDIDNEISVFSLLTME